MKLTTRLGKKGLTIKQLLKTNHSFKGPISPWNGIPGSELYYGQSYDGTPSWLDFLQTGSEQPLEDLKNQGAAALLFLPIDGRMMIYIFGYGLGSLVEGKTEWDYGIKVVLNSINANGIRSLDSKTIDRRAKNKRIQLATQGTIGEFELDIVKDLVSQIAGVSVDTTFAKGLVGSESLMLTVDMEATSIVKKTKQIYNVYNEVKYKTTFNWIDFVSPVKDKTLIDELNAELQVALDNAIKANDSSNFLLSYPEIIEAMNIDHICYGGFGPEIESDYPDFEKFLVEYLAAGHTGLSHTFDQLSIDQYDGEDTYKKSYGFYRCLSTELEYNLNYYVLTNGNWFRLEKTYYDEVTKFFEALINNSTDFTGPTKVYVYGETAYLESFSQPDHEIMDQVFFMSGQKKIEFADIVSGSCEMIHVKGGGSGNQLGHMFNQGFVSASLMLNDINYRKEFKRAIKISSISSKFKTKDFLPSEVTVVYRIIKSGKKPSLSFFAKIALYDAYKKIRGMGYNFRLDWLN